MQFPRRRLSFVLQELRRTQHVFSWQEPPTLPSLDCPGTGGMMARMNVRPRLRVSAGMDKALEEP